MPLSRLENFLINTDGNILYVNPSDLDATDSFDNKGNSLTRPFKTIQRALIEAARFSYQIGANNDRFDRTTILLYPGEHLVDNRPGYSIKNNGGSQQYFDVNGNIVATPAVELNNNTIFDLDNAANVLHKFNSVDGGVIVPKGTSLVGLDLRKTKIRPLYVPDPADSNIDRSAIFRVTGGCYFWQFSLFDADRSVFYNKNFAQKANPSFSHHKLTCFEYADGITTRDLTDLTDLEMYYFKLMNAYGNDTGNRAIIDFPTATDFEPNSPEFKIVGDLSANDFGISELTSSGLVASVLTDVSHNLSVDDSFRVAGVGSDTYNGSFRVAGITSDRKFTYSMLDDATDDVITIGGGEKVIIEADNVTGASPYIFNISLRSTFGMCGMHADGSKATGFKSMVVAQFTGIGLQKDTNAFLIYNEQTGQYDTNETAPTSVAKPLYINQDAVYKTSYESFHVKASNDAVIQAVSVFAIGFANHFIAEDGADQSITNSNSNFGAKSLISKGFKKQSFDRDNTGYITHIVPPKDLQESSTNIVWRSLDPTTTLSVGNTSRLYILGETDEGNPPTNITNGYRVGSKEGELLYLDANIGGTTQTFSAPVLMQVPSGDGPSAKKSFKVSRSANANNINVSTNALTLTSNHTLFTGESVKVYSDNGVLPDGIVYDRTYYAIVGGSLGTNEIKLANSFNNANEGIAVDIKNASGGIIEVCSRVTDKIPGDLGHPIQYDSTENNWYILTNSTSNGVFDSAIVGYSTAIAANNSSTYVQRVPENRDLSDRIYKLRYVIPKEFANAKAPTKNFILQESKTVNEESAITDINSNRNPRIIAGISTSGSTVTVTSEKPHGLFVNDRVRIKNVKSSTNTTGLDDEGFNGYYTVTAVTGTKGFQYTNANNGGTFTDNISTRGIDLPAFERNEYNTTYIIQEVETLQEYIDGIQDGIFYLTCLIGNISPTVAEFSDQKYKQNFYYLYPVVDKDNSKNDPDHTISAASNKMLGQVDVNDTLNSITKEATIEYLRDNKVGFGITGATWSGGTATIFTERNHNLSRITGLTINTQGSGYGSGISTTLYNVTLTGGTGTGSDATANVVVSAAGTITGVTVVDGGGAYGVGNTMSVTGGNGDGVVQVASVSNELSGSIQTVGIGTTTNRSMSGYNGVFPVNSIPNARSITFSSATNPGIYTTSSGIAYPVEVDLSVNSLTGVAGTTLAGICTVTTASHHGLYVGNKIKISGVVGTSSTVFNNDFIVQEILNSTDFTITANPGVPMTGAQATVRVSRYGIGAFGEDTSLQSEKIAGSLISISSGYKEPLDSSVTNTATTISVNSTVGLTQGDFLQIDDEIVRISSVTSSTNLAVIRGAMGTRSKPHSISTIAKRIKVVPSEVRRFSSIRASGHTFEYVGYGPGNYSTALPQRIQRTLDPQEELLSIYLEQKGGVTFFSGMNDRGEFFTWDGRVKPVERFLGEIESDLTATFDDVYIRNTLRVGGGPNRNLPSEFRGPVNFTNKITSTDVEDGINAIKLQLKGNNIVNPLLQVGPDANPSLIVNQTTELVGIKTASPAHELDVSGTIRADIYENFKLSDLPNTATEEVTFKRNRVLKVNESGTGYELVDAHELDTFKLRSYGISNDGTVYVGTGSTSNSKLVVSGISTAKFFVGEKVKLFGVTATSDSVTVPGVPSVPSFTKVGTSTTVSTYRYWVAQYHLRNGKVGVSTQINPTSGIGMTAITEFNDQDHITLTLNRTDTNHGLLVYRQESVGAGTTNINDAKLVGILGPKELDVATSGILWKDYGVYDKTSWSPNGAKNEYTSDQIHFPNIATTGQRRGWALDEIVSIGAGSVTVNTQYDFNSTAGFGTDATVKVAHDNTYALSEAIDDTVASGGNYLDLPSGTYLAQTIAIPTNFTLRGNGRNTVLKQQFFANDTTDGGGNNLTLDGNFVGIGTTNARDVTIQDVTVDGNFANNIRFKGEISNYLVKLDGVSSTLIKSMEIRNSPAHGLYIYDSNRVSVENSSFVDGSLTDRYPFEPIQAQESNVLRINDSLFENYPGAVDVSVTSVVSTGGNIIRNCGTGLKVYATGKITTSNNIILGPADEYIPSPDIYDSDFNSVNITIDRSVDFKGPVLQYIHKGDAKDLSTGKVTIISAGIGTIVGQGTTNETIGTRFVDFNITTPNSGTFGRANGYIQLSMPLSKTSQIGLSSALGYNIIAQEFLQKPAGFSTFIGIGTGVWNTIGAGATQYTVTLADFSQASGISTGDVVKLVNHSVSPSLSSRELTVAEKIVVGITTVNLRLTGITTTSQINGNQSGYISIRNTFNIAKGRVGVI